MSVAVQLGMRHPDPWDDVKDTYPYFFRAVLRLRGIQQAKGAGITGINEKHRRAKRAGEIMVCMGVWGGF